jgi:hypothetical protein
MSLPNSFKLLSIQLLTVCFAVACAGDIEKVDSNSDGGTQDGGATTTEPTTSPNQGGTDSSTTDSSTTNPNPIVEGTCSESGQCTGYTTEELACKDVPYRSCISTCGTDFPPWRDAECVNGNWQCPAGFVDLDSCAPNSCATSPSTCCNPTTGVIGAPTCGANGEKLACEEGTITTPSNGCVPPSLGVTECMTLDKLSCDGTVLRCDQFETFCDCEKNEAGNLAWSCKVYLIMI